jgi:hypothetical protein
MFSLHELKEALIFPHLGQIMMLNLVKFLLTLCQ